MPRFLRPFRSKDKDGNSGSSSRSKSRTQNELARFRPNVWIPPGYHRAAGFLDEKILDRIFQQVCPHTNDDRYRNSEETAGSTGDGCVLCETRDLAACMQVNRTWYRAAERSLYRTIRFESVHYCEREDWLRDHRKHKNQPDKIDELRLTLLERTLGEFQAAASFVEILKLPYQIREGYKPNLARIVSRTPNLKYVDLPEGVFSDQQSCMILKQQLMTRCPDLRFMKYRAGGEATFARHSYEDLWYNLEAASLEELDVEPDVLTYSLARMINLSKLNMSNMAVLADTIFQPNPSLPALPAVRTLKIADAPRITAHGLLAYLQRPEVSASITTLQLEHTGVQITDVHMLLAAASRLRTFAIQTKVAQAMQPNSVPPLASRSLRSIFFQISDEAAHTAVGGMPCDSYYDYLAFSITARSMPALRSVRAYCPQFPDMLVSLAPPPAAPFSDGGGGGDRRFAGSQSHPMNVPPPSLGMPPRLSAQPGSLAPPALPSPSVPPSMANRMSALSLGPNAPSHGRSLSSMAPYGGPPSISASLSQRPSSSYGMGYNPNPFSPSPTALAQASAPEASVPTDIVARLGVAGNGLTIYTKPPNAEEMEWLVTEFVPPEPGSGGQPGTSGGVRGARPISLIGLQRPGTAGGSGQSNDLGSFGDNLKGGPLKSPDRGGLVGSHGGRLVGNGFGGYVEVKDDGKKNRRKGSDWMG